MTSPTERSFSALPTASTHCCISSTYPRSASRTPEEVRRSAVREQERRVERRGDNCDPERVERSLDERRLPRQLLEPKDPRDGIGDAARDDVEEMCLPRAEAAVATPPREIERSYEIAFDDDRRLHR